MIQDLDTNHAIKISERVWWVGHYIEGDPFQCHTYLIENGDQSVLFDPGSKLTFNHTSHLQKSSNLVNEASEKRRKKLLSGRVSHRRQPNQKGDQR